MKRKSTSDIFDTFTHTPRKGHKLNAVKMLALLLLVCLAGGVHGYNSSTSAPFWWLNTFLDGTSIGRFETSPGQGYYGLGPCPSYGLRCKFYFNELPTAVQVGYIYLLYILIWVEIPLY
jgi:hypothetical protein